MLTTFAALALVVGAASAVTTAQDTSPTPTRAGFRLVFELPAGWDSG